MDAIAACRTAALGGHASVCSTCGALQVWYNSCGNRHCPQCQAFEKEKWVEARRKELLPVPYLHIVFTLPDKLNPLVLSNDKLMYNLLFKAAWMTLQQIGLDPKWLGAQMGMVAVLHITPCVTGFGGVICPYIHICIVLFQQGAYLWMEKHGNLQKRSIF